MILSILDMVVYGTMFAIWSKKGWYNLVFKLGFLAMLIAHILQFKG